MYAAIGVFGMSFGLATSCVSSSRVLHSDLLSSIFKAPMSFFDTTPLGRIINRLSRDVDTVDVNIPMTIRIWLGTFCGVFTTIFVIAYSTPIFLTVTVPLGLFYYFIQVIFLFRQVIFFKKSMNMFQLKSYYYDRTFAKVFIRELLGVVQPHGSVAMTL